MTKRALKRMAREGEFNAGDFDDKVRRLPVDSGGWPPHGHGAHGNKGGYGGIHGDNRDQSYVKTIKEKSDGQAALLKAIDAKNLVVALGPAGNGKTYLAIAKAVEALEAGRVGRIVLLRPAVEAG